MATPKNQTVFRICCWLIINGHFLSGSATEFGTSNSRLVHKIISILPEKCQLFVLSDHTLNSESLNVNNVAIIQYARFKITGKRLPISTLFRSVQCRIVLLNLIAKYSSSYKQDELSWWNLRFRAL